jgi:hypothetical protein
MPGESKGFMYDNPIPAREPFENRPSLVAFAGRFLFCASGARSLKMAETTTIRPTINWKMLVKTAINGDERAGSIVWHGMNGGFFGAKISPAEVKGMIAEAVHAKSITAISD